MLKLLSGVQLPAFVFWSLIWSPLSAIYCVSRHYNWYSILWFCVVDRVGALEVKKKVDEDEFEDLKHAFEQSGSEGAN